MESPVRFSSRACEHRDATRILGSNAAPAELRRQQHQSEYFLPRMAWQNSLPQLVGLPHQQGGRTCVAVTSKPSAAVLAPLPLTCCRRRCWMVVLATPVAATLLLAPAAEAVPLAVAATQSTGSVKFSSTCGGGSSGMTAAWYDGCARRTVIARACALQYAGHCAACQQLPTACPTHLESHLPRHRRLSQHQRQRGGLRVHKAIPTDRCHLNCRCAHLRGGCKRQG